MPTKINRQNFHDETSPMAKGLTIFLRFLKYWKEVIDNFQFKMRSGLLEHLDS